MQAFTFFLTYFQEQQYYSIIILLLKLLLEDIYAENNKTKIMSSQISIVKTVVENDQKMIIQFCLNMINSDTKNVFDVFIHMMKI